MKTVNGDLIDLAKRGKFDVIVHGCNCFCAMGGGIAFHIRKQFPEAYKADQLTEIGDESKLGTYTKATVVRDNNKDFSGKRIGYPAIGAGLAGGDWNIIKNIIDTALQGEDHTFVKFA